MRISDWSSDVCSSDLLDAIVLGIPNLPDESVPAGKDESDNVEQARWGTPRSFDYKVLDHVEPGARHGWLDGDAVAKLHGPLLTVLRGQLACPHRATLQLLLVLPVGDHGYAATNVPPPLNA